MATFVEPPQLGRPEQQFRSAGPTDPLSRAAQSSSFARQGRQTRTAGPPIAALSLGRAERSAQQGRPDQQFRSVGPTDPLSRTAQSSSFASGAALGSVQVVPNLRKQSKKLRIPSLIPSKWRRYSESNLRNSAYQLCFRSSGAKPTKAIQETLRTNFAYRL